MLQRKARREYAGAHRLRTPKHGKSSLRQQSARTRTNKEVLSARAYRQSVERVRVQEPAISLDVSPSRAKRRLKLKCRVEAVGSRQILLVSMPDLPRRDQRYLMEKIERVIERARAQ